MGLSTQVRRSRLVEAGRDTEHISLEVVEAPSGAGIELAPGLERLAVIQGGRGRARVDGRDLGMAGERHDVFESAGDALYLPASAAAILVAEGGPLEVAIASASPGAPAPGSARIIRAGEQRVATVGRDVWRRTVRTILGPEDQASRLLAGETLNPPGLWSSYPPHRHDRESADEVRLEEVYLFRVRPAGGFGVQVHYHGEGAEDGDTRIVGDGDFAVIRSGYHPVVAAPGYELYYLWVMAGEGRVMKPHLDPRHRWVEEQPR